jgi:hypothetical protein
MLSLNDADRDEFLHLQKNLILFTNKKFKLYQKFKSIEDLLDFTQDDVTNGVFPIREKMYQAENLKEFCDSNKLNNLQREIVNSWSAVYSDEFYVIKHLQNETVLLTGNEKKLYGVVGISNGLNHFFPEGYLPILIKAKLIPFKEKIIYDGFFGTHNVQFGGNISRRLKQIYSEIKGEKGIISKPENNISLGDQVPNKDADEIIKFQVKQDLKNRSFPNKAWALAKKSEENKLSFENEYAKFYAKHRKSSIKSHKEIKAMYYAMYRDCIIGVMETKKLLIEFCMRNHPDIAKYAYIFKA